MSKDSTTTKERVQIVPRPLLYAVSSGEVECVQMLLAYSRTNIDGKVNGRTALSLAVEHGIAEIVQLLVDRGADVTEKDLFGRSLLSYAAKAGQTEIARILVDRGADVTEKDGYGRSPLSYAAEAGHAEIVQLLIDLGADVTEKDENGRSLLSYAAKSGQTEIARILVDRGADVTEKDLFGRSPLLYAADAGHAEIVRLLVDRGADVTEKDVFGISPLLNAAEVGETEIVRLLVDLGADVTEKDENGRSALSYAVEDGLTEMVQLLVDRGADVTEKDWYGRGLLSYAAESGYSGVITVLIKEGSNVDDKDSNGRTALSNMNIVKTLIEAGADVDVRAADGETPLDTINRDGITHLGSNCSSRNVAVCKPCAYPDQLQNSIASCCDYTGDATAARRLLPVGAAGLAISSAISDFHEELDHFAALLQLSLQESDWKGQWLTDKTNTMQSIYEKLVDEEPLSTVSTTYMTGSMQLSCCEYAAETTSGTNEEAVYAIEDWFISREDVEFNEWNRTEGDAEITTYEGKWLEDQGDRRNITWMDKNEFQKVADRWYSLSHPNVRKLFGACHIESKPFFVYEYGKRLLDVLIEKQQSPWKYLYDAALGVQLLHQRSIVHGDLRCSNIVVGLDGVAKVGGLEYRMDHYYFWFDTEQAGWASPELLSGQVKSLSSDIYAFGMCILEAITLKRPWFPLELYGYYRNVRRRKLPDRPESFSDDQWDLVTKMCAYKSADRISIGYVVLQFKKFVETRNYLVLVAHDTHIEFPQLELNTIPVKLQTIRDRCQQLPESKWLVRDVWPALEFLFHTMVSQQIRPTDTVAEKYCAALRSLDRYLRTTLSEKSTAHAARSRQVAESHHVIYEELDRLLDMVHVSKSHPIRSWKRSEASIDQRILKDANCVKASAIPGAVSLKMFGLSRTELCDGRTGDEPQAVPTWFLPLRKLQFSSSSEIGQGAFGKVYKGVWLDTPVVVKFMGYEGDRDTISNELFLHEVRVWHRLKKHPHIVELYGACHVDKRYFVCEYASNGDLRDYLKRAGNDHLVWDKLYEIALGLAYMHGLSVVHNDLKCDNVLVGMDGKAKLIDFGLSAIVGDSEIMVEVKHMGAVHWKSPEYLAGERPSFASDVYSFAMCILEAVTGDIPWGRNMYSAVVRIRVKNGDLPTRPGMMNDKQWKRQAVEPD
ncbi:Serine/threonine protein kinase, partial [Globisporangium splendens]